MSTKEMLQQMIEKAWSEYVMIHKAEIESGYADAMDGFERKEAEGYAIGLEAAYQIVYDEVYEGKAREFDAYAYEESLNGNA
jgi:hypothetical protein